MSALLTLDHIAAATPDGRPLFEDLTLSLGRERLGVVGRNGSGKSTLFRLIEGVQPPLRGELTVAGRLGVLRQTPALKPDARLLDLLGMAEIQDRLARIEAGEGTEQDFAEADWEAPGRIEVVLADLGLADLSLDHPASALSGGQATRAGLAGLLLAQPDLLLLDEPTNNLDAEARSQVMGVIERWRGGVIVVSHDRALLRRMDRILELSDLGPRLYGGGYDLFQERRAAEAEAARRELEAARREVGKAAREAQEARERQERRDAAGRRFASRRSEPKILLGAQARRAEATAGRVDRLAERRDEAVQAQLESAEARVERLRGLKVELPSSRLPTGRKVLELEDLGFAWPGQPPLIEGLSLRVLGPERLAIAGPNGSGKSTLLKLVSGALKPTAGSVRTGVEMAVLDQRAELLRPEETILDGFRRLNPDADANMAHTALARFLFRNTAAHQRVGSLSGGERLRAALACVLSAARPPQLLILDEPTNHLDLVSLEAMETALADYDGALLVVSHDEDFLAGIGVERRLSPISVANGALGAAWRDSRVTPSR